MSVSGTMTVKEVCSELYKSVYGETLIYGAALAIKEIAGKSGKTVEEVVDEIISEGDLDK